jgi:tetratricopeptide (TPR) repeat protein
MLGFAVGTALTLWLSLASPDTWPADVVKDPKARSAQMSALGDRMFREARFEDAGTAYSQALNLDKSNVQGHLGMGKLAMLLSDVQRAAHHYSAAYQIAPRDPDAILAFADVVQSPGARKMLLRNFLAFAGDARNEDVRARLHVAEQTETTSVAALNSPYQTYRIPLSNIGTANIRTAGLSLRARINGGRELKLIVDTGAAGIVLNASAGSQANLAFLGDAVLSGFGSAKPGLARIARAESFETGGLKIANVLLDVSETDMTREADGWIGLDVFKDFLIRLDARARTLELAPFADQAGNHSEAGMACEDCLQAYRLGSLLLLRGTVNGHANGYFILDSGSPYTMVSRKLLSEHGRPATFSGAQGGQDVAVPSTPVSIRLGNRRLMGFEYATFDTSAISSRNGTEIAGAIGYSVLRNLTVTVNYRDGMVKLGNPGRD